MPQIILITMIMEELIPLVMEITMLSLMQMVDLEATLTLMEMVIPIQLSIVTIMEILSPLEPMPTTISITMTTEGLIPLVMEITMLWLMQMVDLVAESTLREMGIPIQSSIVTTREIFSPPELMPAIMLIIMTTEELILWDMEITMQWLM